MEEPRFEKISEDERGANYRVIIPGKGGDRELVLIFSKAGSWRGGHSHDTDEVALMLDGSMVYHKELDEGGVSFKISSGEAYENKAGQPHIGEFIEDSWLIDWKLGPKPHIGEFTTTDYPPYQVLKREGQQLFSQQSAQASRGHTSSKKTRSRTRR